jgi:hypothetical protein
MTFDHRSDIMDRRELLGMMGAGTAGLLAMGSREAVAGPGHLNQAHEDCLKACADCAKECEMMFHHCFKLTAQGQKEHAKPAHIALDCAEFCGLSAKLIARMSPLMAISCSACADACKRCGDECEKSDSAEMKKCAEACRKCEQSCREMVRSMQNA